MTIYEMLEEKVTEIFLAEQEKRNIETGDCDPWLSWRLDCAMEKLAEVVEDILKYQES